MYKASKDFFDAIYRQDVMARAYLKFGDVLIEDTDQLVSLVINDEIYDSELSQFIGTFVGKYGEVEINTQEYELENQQIEIYIGAVLPSGNVEYVPYGTFVCYEVSKPKKEVKTKIKIIDKKIVFNEEADLSIIEYPITHKNILKAVCTKLGIIYKETEFPNSDAIVETEVFFGYNATYSDIVKAVAQAAGGWAKINRNDELEICWIGKDAFQISADNYFELDISGAYGPINSLVLSRSPQNDNIYLKDEESIQTNGLTEIQIINNPLVEDNREALIVPIFQRLSSFSYIPLECKAQGNPCFETGDQLVIEDVHGNTFLTYLLNHKLDFTGGMHSSISAPALTKTEIEYSSAKSIEKSILETELKVDKVKGEITASIEQTNTKIDQNETITNSQFEEMKITIDGIRNQITTTGGNNFIEDSMGVFGGRFGSDENVWIGTYAVDRSQAVKNRNIYGYALMLMNCDLVQRKTVPNGVYTISFEYCTHLDLASVSVVINGEEILLTNNEFTKVEKTFEVNANELSIKFISDADQSCTICNLMGNQGSAAAVWSLAPGESWGDYVKIGRGIEIGSEDSEVTFNANSDIIGFKNKGGAYVAVFTDTGADMKEINIQSKARIVGLLYQRINGQTVINQVGVD